MARSTSPDTGPALPERGTAVWAYIFAAVFLVFAAGVLLLPLHHTLELWDESRNANNAIEIALRGHWIAPTYGFVVDRWNTKPPLLIWIIAALERAGLPPLLALRLPSELAALGTILAVYGFGMCVLRRPFAALAAALLLMSSTLFFGLHMAMSGDYDALLCLLTTVYALAFFCFVEGIIPGPAIGFAGAALALAVLTKGIAGVLLLPGLFVYAVARGQLLRLARDWRFWASLLGAVAVIALYYLGRDHLDPGYLHDVWGNELGGRFGKANEGHQARTLFYANLLVHQFEPGIVVMLLGVVTLLRRGTDTISRRSHAAALFMAVAAGVFLAVMTVSKTKIFYYCCPAIPLLSLLGGLGLADTLPLLGARLRAVSLRTLQTAAAALLVLTTFVAMYVNRRAGAAVSGGEQAFYGEALQALHAQRRGPEGAPVYLLDPGFETNAHFHQYDPIADYYAKESTFRGMPVTPQRSATGSPRGAWLVTCDPDFAARLRAETSGARLQSYTTSGGQQCVFGKR